MYKKEVDDIIVMAVLTSVLMLALSVLGGCMLNFLLFLGGLYLID